MMMNKNLIVSLIASASLTSCATIVTGSRQKIEICSNPADANVWIDNFCYGKTPMIAELTRDSNHFVRIELDGFMPYEVCLTKNLNGWFFGNILLGGIIGIVVDATTGAMYKLTPDQIHTNLCDCGVVHSKRSKDSCIAVVLKADPSWEKIGNLTAVN